MPKTYYGGYAPNGTSVMVHNDGLIYALDHIQHIPRQSRTALAWGFAGSGPADTALSILADCLGIVRARTLYQQFTLDMIAKLPGRWVLSEAEVLAWAAKNEPPAVHAISVPQTG